MNDYGQRDTSETSAATGPSPRFQWNAADYARSSTAQQRWARELIAKLALRGDECVLDIGSGDGKVTAEIAAVVTQGAVLGIDNCPEMVQHARRQLAAVGNLRFELRDARQLDFHGQFDVVFSNAVLHWVVDHRPVLRGIAAALKPGGRILLQMGGRGNAATVLAVVREVVARTAWRRFFEGFDFPYGFYAPDDYLPWLAEAGLSPKRVELIPKDMVHPDREALAGWFRTTWMPWTDRVPTRRRQSFVTDVIDAYAATYPPDDAGQFHLPMMRLEVEATATG